MLPDFPDLKKRLNSQLLHFVRTQVPVLSPLLEDIKTFVQHEGRDGDLTRSDQSTEASDFQRASIPFEVPRKEMRSFDLLALQIRLHKLAKDIGDHQSQLMLSRVGEAAAAVGNTVDARGELKPEHLLDMMRKVQVDFDPATNKPKPGFKFVMHPDIAPKIMAKVEEWEKDPAFMAELDAIEEKQREEWHDREARRTLAD